MNVFLRRWTLHCYITLAQCYRLRAWKSLNHNVNEVHNSFQHFPALILWWSSSPNIYQLLLQTWYQVVSKKCPLIIKGATSRTTHLEKLPSFFKFVLKFGLSVLTFVSWNHPWLFSPFYCFFFFYNTQLLFCSFLQFWNNQKNDLKCG